MMANRLKKMAEEESKKEEKKEKKRIFIPSAADFPQLEFTMGLVVSMGILQSAVTVAANPARKRSEDIWWPFILFAVVVALSIIVIMTWLLMILERNLMIDSDEKQAALKWVESDTFTRVDGSKCKFSEASTRDKIYAKLTYQDCTIGSWESNSTDSAASDKFMHDYASLFTNFRGGANKQTFYLLDKLRKVGTILLLAFLYDMPFAQSLALFAYGILSAAFTFNAAPYSSFSSNTNEAVMAVGQALPFLLAAILNFTPSLEGVIGSAMVIVANPCLSLFLP